MGTINNRTKVRHSPGTELLQVERNEGSSEITETQSILWISARNIQKDYD